MIETLAAADLKTISSWMDTNKLTINTSKTKYMVFGSMSDNKLKFDVHIRHLCSRLSSVSGLFRKISPYIPGPIKRTKFYSIFVSCANYAMLVWGSTYATKVAKVQTVQNRCIRNKYLRNRRVNTIDIHKQHNILPIIQQQKILQCLHMYSISSTIRHSNSQYIFLYTYRTTA